MARKDQALYRRCPACGVVSRAGDFKRATGASIAVIGRTVACSSCGHIAPYWTFPHVEKPTEPEDGD